MAQTLTEKGSATRRRIIEGAAMLVRDYGVANTGLDQIRTTTGTSGGQLLHYFPDGKAQLMLAVAEFEADQILEEQQPHLGDLSSPEAWRAWAEALFADYERQGANCGLNALMGQLDPQDPAVQLIVRNMYDAWEASLAAGIEKLRQQGTVAADVDPAALASAYLASVQGGILMMAATGTTQNLRAALDLILETVIPA